MLLGPAKIFCLIYSISPWCATAYKPIMCNQIFRYDDVMLGIGHFFVKIASIFAFYQTRWTHHDRMGISLLDACVFDVLDTLVYESQLKKFKNGEFTGGTRPSQKVVMDKKRSRILEAAYRFGQDNVHFGAKEVGLISNLAIIIKESVYFPKLLNADTLSVELKTY